jgi:short-subunit dehydrogenase
MKTDILNDRWALITGASSGLGADFARVLASLGCHLVITARRDERLGELKSEIVERHDRLVVTIPMDLAAPGASRQLYDQIKADGIMVDVLVNNAGFGIYGKFTEVDWRAHQQMVQLNIVALAHLTSLFLPDMLDRDFGYILQVSSYGAFQPTPTYAVYAASKSFVLNFSEALNYELRGTSVKCTAISPGPTITEFHSIAGQRLESWFFGLFKMESMAVARAGIRAMLRGYPSVVIDWKIAMISWFSQRLPRRLATAMAAWLMSLE